MKGHDGVLIGIVESLDEDYGRVYISYPHLAYTPSSPARIAAPMAGKSRGIFFRPEKGDEVLVACEHGDLRRPYVLGALWSKADPPPDTDGSRTDNNQRVIVSRSGHKVIFDDTRGGEKITIVDQAGKRSIVLDGSSIQIKAEVGDVSVEAKGNLALKAGGNLTVEAKQVAIKADLVEIDNT
jgi:uncharacterized protein involved in type VI secretion and phage assembly